MNSYLSIFSARSRTLLQYRAAALAGIGTQLFWGYIRIMIYDAFYRSSSAPQPMTYAQVVSYVWLGQAMLLLTMLYPDNEIAAMIRSGTVAYELTRPLDLYSLWYARCFSGRAAPLTLRSVPILIIAALFLNLAAPASVGAVALFIVSTLLSIALAASIVTLLSISLMWTISGDGVAKLAPAIVYLFSGILIPLPLFPDWMQPIMNAMPFRGLIDVPFRLYLGHFTQREAAFSIAHQALWIVALIFIGRLALKRGMRRLVVQGG